jgi:hypothetical protein
VYEVKLSAQVLAHFILKSLLPLALNQQLPSQVQHASLHAIAVNRLMFTQSHSLTQKVERQSKLYSYKKKQKQKQKQQSKANKYKTNTKNKLAQVRRKEFIFKCKNTLSELRCKVRGSNDV